MIEDPLFVFAVDLSKHPIINFKQILKTKYYYTLKYYVNICTSSVYADARLELYKRFLLQNNTEVMDEKKCITTIINAKFHPWKNKYKLWLICDLALIIGDLLICQKAVEMIKTAATKKQRELLEQLAEFLKSNGERGQTSLLLSAAELMKQYCKNIRFCNTPEKRIVITANMSAGKSTLINALIGINLARTSQEVCTGNICYFYNMPFDDGTIHFKGKKISFSSSEKEYKNFEWDSTVAFASIFNSIESINHRVCLIDTPGVNSAIKREHGKISKECITMESYDYVLYVLNSNKLGTDEEIAYLKWIIKNADVRKVLFILNKLDNFKKSEDSIAASIEGVKSDLEKLGYTNPIIFPISAYFAYLLKKEVYGRRLSDDEKDELVFFKKKFRKQEYNLARFYGEGDCGEDEIGFFKRTGLYYLEKTLYGGLI